MKLHSQLEISVLDLLKLYTPHSFKWDEESFPLVIYEVLDHDGLWCLSEGGLPTSSQTSLKDRLLALGTWAQRVFKYSPGQDATFCMKWKPTGPTVFYSQVILRRKAQDLFLYHHGSGNVGVRCWNLLGTWALPPKAAQPSVCSKRQLPPSWPGLSLDPIIHSGLSFGTGFSKCPHFPVSQTQSAVCFSTYPVKLWSWTVGWSQTGLAPLLPHQ